MSKKIAYIIPGLFQDHTTPGYKQVSTVFSSAGYTVKKVKIHWKYKTMSDYIEQFKSQLNHSENDTVAVLGFSLGAMIAAITAAELQPKNLYLCSLSPFFSEDLPHIPEIGKRVVGRRRMKDFELYSLTEITKGITAKTHLIAGEHEHPVVHHKMSQAHALIKRSSTHIAPGAAHDISAPGYLDTIQSLVS